MTPNEKAKELIALIAETVPDIAGHELDVLNVAHIAVNEIIKAVREWEARTGHIDETKYWEKVKQYLVI